ncbi:MAG TPA: biotin/lipoyl-containing protein [Pyrinomonadaceae bacterium]
MKLQAQTGDQIHDIEIKREGRRAFAKIDGREYELEVSEPEPGVLLFKHDGRIYEAAVTQPGKAGDPTHVRVGTNEFDIRILDPKRLRSVGAGSESADGVVEIKTAMPGKVVRILVDAGSEVKKGDGVMVVEAMKMQNELKSPKTGIVKEIRSAEGSTVSAGDVLARIE